MQTKGVTMASAEEAKAKHIEIMGLSLGSQYSALWQEVARLHMDWSEYVELFAAKSTRIDLINRAAGTFFRLIQDRFWEGTLLHIARLTDPSKSFGGKGKHNLTIQNLPALIDDTAFKASVAELVAIAVKAADFCRDWRNRLIAHRDLTLAIDQTAVPLAAASKKHVDDALKAIANVLNALDAHYMDSETAYGSSRPLHGAVSLLYVIDDGLRAEEARRIRRKNGEPFRDEYGPRDI
jgi:hypothetical protein